MARRKTPPNPFRWLDSLPEVIRLVVMMYVKFPLSLRTSRISCTSAGSRFATRRCGSGGTGSGRCSPRRKRVQVMPQHTHRKWHLDEST